MRISAGLIETAEPGTNNQGTMLRPSPAKRKLRIVGEQYGGLTVMYKMPSETHKNHWMCACVCGAMKAFFTGHLRSGTSKSCGCLSREAARLRSTKHGHSAGGKTSRTFEAYRAMLRRCLYPSQRGYKNYGGRGIKPCDEWLGPAGFASFLASMGECPPGLTLERIDVDGPYAPWNCRWATQEEQAANKRSVQLIDGKPKTVWARERGVELSTAYRAAKRDGRAVVDVIKQMGGPHA